VEEKIAVQQAEERRVEEGQKNFYYRQLLGVFYEVIQESI
jgi:hypothetical protein